MDVILLSIAFLVNLVLGLFVLWANPKNSINISFSLIALSLGIWAFTWAMALTITDLSAKLFWSRLMLTGPALLPAAALGFASVFPKHEKKTNLAVLILLFILPAVIFLLIVPTNLYVQTIRPAPWGIDFIPGFAYFVYTIYFSIYIGLAFLILITKYEKSREPDKERIRYLFLGTFLTALAGLIVNLILPLMNITYFNRLGPMSTVIFISFTTYAIVKHRLMDISIVISRTVAELLTIFFLGSIYLGLVWLHQNYISPSIDWLFLAWTIVFGTIVGHVYEKTRLFIQTTADKLILRGKYNYYKELAQASIKVSRELSLKEILKVLHETFYNVIEIYNPRIFLPENFSDPSKETQRYVVYDKETFSPQRDGKKIKLDDPLLNKLVTHGSQLGSKKTSGQQLIIPCLLENRLIAIFVLGKKLSEVPYTDQDIQLLEVLASQAAVALDHTRSYEKIKRDFADNQKQLYDSERLLARSEKIASMANLIQEYNHEIRTPLTILRTKISNLPDEAKVIEGFKDIKKNLIKQIDRAADIIESTLRLSKPKEHVEVELDLNQVIEEALTLYQPIGIKFKKELKPIPKMRGDFEDLKILFINLLKNAREASPDEGEITIETYATVENEKTNVCAKVSDNGSGISKENMEKIFEPFFSTHVTKGRGLGLSIVFRIVREHLGKIEVDSEVGAGSSFKIQFPAIIA